VRDGAADTVYNLTMEWSDEGIVLGARRHGEAAAIVTLLTREHGRHAGLVRGGAGKRGRAVYLTGNRVVATWRARLAEHLGNYTCELTHAYAAEVLGERLPLAALAASAALAEAVLPEREPDGAVFDGFAALEDALLGPGWAAAYVCWERNLLAALGFGLDLGACAATGVNDGLVYVSPRTGRAVSAAAGEPYRDRLLALPEFLCDGRPVVVAEQPSTDDILEGLRLTGHFLERCLFAPHDRALPAARQRLVDAVAAIPTLTEPTISGGQNTS
jgi:DNA repair protein RecO (recombination protein O)